MRDLEFTYTRVPMSVPGMDDGWGIYRESNGEQELLAVISSEFAAERHIDLCQGVFRTVLVDGDPVDPTQTPPVIEATVERRASGQSEWLFLSLGGPGLRTEEILRLQFGRSTALLQIQPPYKHGVKMQINFGETSSDDD